MKKDLQILFICLFFIPFLQAQDVIYKKDGSEIKAKVVEIEQANIKYKKFEQLDGPLRNLDKAVIFMIIYEDGTKEVFVTPVQPVEASSVLKVENDDNEKEKKNTPVKVERLEKFIDERDSNEYRTVLIGDQWWMVENLRFSTRQSRCYQDSKNFCFECGQFYPFQEALLVCPKGWHLPSDNEWISLEIAAGMSAEEARGMGWRGTDPGQAPALLYGGEMKLDLSMCGTLQYFEDGSKSWSGRSSHAFYWTSTKQSDNLIIIRHLKDRLSIQRLDINEKSLLPIRCVKD